MSTTPSPADSPVSVQPLHHPSQAATVVVPQAPLGNANTNGVAPGMGVKALLAKKMAKSHNPNFISPTDNLMTPVTQKLSAQKQKNFAKGAKPMGQLFSQPEVATDRSQEAFSEEDSNGKLDDDENPF